jgi:ribonuclease HI
MARSGRLNPIRNHGTGALTQEIRAVGMAVEDFPGRSIKFLVDSTSAIDFLRSWQAGYTDRMPPGYSLRPRINGDRKPALVRLAETIAGRTDLRFVHVAGHTGVHLNEVADSLAKMAREAAVRRVDEAVLGERATRLVTGFLQEIHGKAAA